MTKFGLVSFIDVRFIAWDIAKLMSYWKLRQISEMLAVKLSDIMSRSIPFENILSIIERLVILVGCKVKAINELEARESKNSLVRSCSLQFNRLTLKSPSRKTDFYSVELLSNSLFK